MRLALLFGLIGSAKASGDYFEPFPTCADCLPASVHDAPGIGFSLSLSSGTAAVHFYNGTVKNIASIPANPEYAALMKRLANSPPPPPPSRWEKLRRSFNKKIGRPATPDVGIIATILVSLRDVTSIAVTSPWDRVAVSHFRIQGLAEPDLWDALEYAHIRPWVAAGLPRPKVVLPLPAAGGYPSQLLESYAVFAGHRKGLCKHYKSFWQCAEEQGNVPLETTLVVGITPTDLRGEIIRTRSAFTDLQPRHGDRAFVDLELGLATSEDKPDFWARVTDRLQGFCGTVPEGFRLDTILLTGENATHPAFLQALRSALVGNGYLQRESDSGGKVSFVHEGGAVIDPVFASARGAAQYARWRQEAPISNVIYQIYLLLGKGQPSSISPLFLEYRDGAWVPPEAHNHPSDSDSDGEGDDLIDVYEVIDLTEGIQDTEELVDDDDPEDEVTDGVTKYLVTRLLAITQDPPKDITPYLMPDVSLPVVEADQQLFKSTVTSMLERAQRYAMK